MKKIQALGLTLSVVHFVVEKVLSLVKPLPEKLVIVAPFVIKLLAGERVVRSIFPIFADSRL